jgi:hypothetical protein
MKRYSREDFMRRLGDAAEEVRSSREPYRDDECTKVLTRLGLLPAAWEQRKGRHSPLHEAVLLEVQRRSYFHLLAAAEEAWSYYQQLFDLTTIARGH